MLRITTETTEKGTGSKLEGKLAGAWVDEVERTWTTIAADRTGKRILVDLCGVSFISAEGKKLLKLLRVRGAEFKCCGPDISATIEEIIATCQP